MIEFFETGMITYPEEVADKPVKYREEDLKAVAMSTSRVNLTDEHTDKVIGMLENFVYSDGVLYVDEPDGVDLEGMGISPSFEFVLKDMGKYYVPEGIVLRNAGLTKTPRSQIFYNSIDKGDGSMEEKEKLLKDIQANQEEIRNQREEIGILRNRNKALDESLQAKAEIEDELKEKVAEISKLEAEMDKLKSKAEAYNELEEKKKEELIEKLSNNDAELKEEYSKMSLEQLEFWSKKNLLNTTPRGVGSHEADVDDGTHQQGNGGDEPATYEDYLEFKKEQGLR